MNTSTVQAPLPDSAEKRPSSAMSVRVVIQLSFISVLMNYDSPQRTHSVASNTSDHDDSHHSDSETVTPPILTTSNVHALTPEQQQKVKEQQQKKEQRGLAAYIATLQSKRAWDALVHGNMS